jgi:hypothetical protein
VRKFVLIETRGEIKVVSVELGSPAILLDLRCLDCGYEFEVPSTESNLVRQAGELTDDFRVGSISAEVYIEKLRAIPARFMRDMIALTDEWSCPKCNEKNPVTFDSCWSCRFKANSREV